MFLERKEILDKRLYNSHTNISENPQGRDHSEDLDVDGKVILEWILGKWGGKVWIGFICLRIGTTGGLL
jgi:hypothetical protein